MQAMTVAQVRKFLEYALLSCHGLVLAIAVTTGMRPNEYLALRWSDIDWHEETVTVVRTLEKGGYGWKFADTKRLRSRRVIKLQGWVINLLARKMRDEKVGQSTAISLTANQIFKKESGAPINSDFLAKNFKRILTEAGLPKFRLYDLRHTAATLALGAGVSPKVVSEQLGHASSAFTLDVYSHVLPHMQAEAVRKVEALLYPAISHILEDVNQDTREGREVAA